MSRFVSAHRRAAARAAALVGATVLAALTSLSPAAAAPSATAPTAAAAAPVPVMIVLDASGSMNQADAPGPRIDAAKAAATDLLGTLPADAQVGLMVYGTGTGSTDAERAAGCQDIRTLAPVAPLNAAALATQIQGISASGYTPIGNALTAAADALPNEGPRSIVLVSDGEDTCAPPTPCDVARDLHRQGIDLTVHTVGFKVDATARDQLSCVAQATGGTYSDAGDGAGLAQALQAKVEVAITGYTTAGTPVTGADRASEQAPLLTPGQYVDTFAVGGSEDTATPGTTKYYTVPVQAGMRPYISATIVPADETIGGATDIGILGLDLDLLGPDGTACRHERGSVILQGARNQEATGVMAGPTFGTPEAKSCPQSGVAVLRVARIGGAWADRPLPVEIVVRMEPPADTAGLLPQASEGDALPAPVAGPPVTLTGGTSFNDAPRLTSGATYSDTLSTGQTRFYRVPVQWGQRLTYLITEVGPAQPSLGYTTPAVWVDVFNPVRSTVTLLADTNGQQWFGDTPDTHAFTSSTPYPARYTNRNGASQREFALDGDYYLRVNADRHEQQPSTTTFLIKVVVSGDVEPGPTYLAAGTAATSGSSTSGTAGSAGSTTPPSGAVAGSATSGSTASPDGVATDRTSADPAVPGWVWALGGALAVGVVAAVVILVTRRRTAGGPPSVGGDR
ncbi:VWA domain-containing protein [Nakamurella sp.]|uniref:vWA domain-containing protein n=1 Tax=Nakamurella sp. TaxID=1869182 RepID=UPI003784473F